MKLEDIPKRDIFDVPEGYFDKLPNAIQAKIASRPHFTLWHSPWVVTLKYALPVLILGIGGYFWLNRPQETVESLLSSVETEDLVAYLDDSDVTTDEVMEEVDFTAGEVNAIEDEVYQFDLGVDDLDEID